MMLNFVKASAIKLTHDPLQFWHLEMSADDNIATCQVLTNPSDLMEASGLIYARAVDEHTDESSKRHCALLILHNDGFDVCQPGVPANQKVGDIVLFHPNDPHSLCLRDGLGNECDRRWAAIFIDFDEELPIDEIEARLKETHDRIFGENESNGCL